MVESVGVLYFIAIIRLYGNVLFTKPFESNKCMLIIWGPKNHEICNKPIKCKRIASLTESW